MASAVYILVTLITFLCAVLLLRGYRNVGKRLLLWSGLCFAGLTVSHVLLFIDLVMVPASVDLYLLRLSTAVASMLLLIYGLVWESE
jgi:hypothetical protein